MPVEKFKNLFQEKYIVTKALKLQTSNQRKSQISLFVNLLQIFQGSALFFVIAISYHV